MDQNKRNQLVAELTACTEPPLIPIDRFFDGNDDLGSIGCNLLAHPGLERFRSILVELSSRSDVEAVYAQIAEIDPGPDCWPFCDTVLVVGEIDLRTLQTLTKPLTPDEVSRIDRELVPSAISNRHTKEIFHIWWD